MNTKFEADWHFIKNNKQKIIQNNKKKENENRIHHDYGVNDEVLYEVKPTLSKYGQTMWDGPFKVVKANDNGTVRLQKGIITETVNIRRIKPYKNPN